MGAAMDDIRDENHGVGPNTSGWDWHGDASIGGEPRGRGDVIADGEVVRILPSTLNYT